MNTTTETVLDRLARPTCPIATLAPQYVAVGFTKERAVQLIVECHMASRLGRGKGARAAKREAMLAATRADRMADEFHGYAAKCEAQARRVFGVLHVTNSDIASRATVESPQF